MATVNMFRGGSPDFKPAFCNGAFAEFQPPFSAPHYDDTPPYNSHADGAQGQGYLNLWFPLVPNLQRNDAHKWQRNALEKVSSVGDIIRLAWVPLRSWVLAQHFELVRGDELLTGVYVKPVAERVKWDMTKKDWVYTINEEYAAAVTASGVGQFPLGTPKETDQRWGFINLAPAPVAAAPATLADEGEEGEEDDAPGEDTSPTLVSVPPCTFGHNIMQTDAKGNPVGGLDDYYGAVVLGLQIAEGTDAAIADIWKGNFALYMSAKVLSFESATQIG